MNARTRLLAATAGTITLAGLGLAPYGAPALAGVDNCSAPHTHQGAYTDFNGDAKGDLAIGIPGSKAAAHPRAGAVEVRYGFSSSPFDGGGKNLTLASPEEGDAFGTSVATADVNGDYCTDLLVGVPKMSVYGREDAGAVALFLGRSTGLATVPDELLTMPAADIGQAQEGARFGASIAVAPGPDPQTARVAVGLPRQDVADILDAGAVAELTLSGAATVVEWSDQALLTQDSVGVSDTAQRDDHFGAALAVLPNGLVVGVPGEGFGNARGAGAVNLIYDDGVTTNRLLSQNTSDVAGAAEQGDHFGIVLATDANRLVVGIPDEDESHAIVDSGKAEVFEYDAVEHRVKFASAEEISQLSADFASDPESGDHFGAAVAMQPEGGLLIGVPDEDVPVNGHRRSDVGMVHQMHSDGTTDSWTQATDGFIGVMEAGDRMGSSLAAAPTDIYYGTICGGVPCEVQRVATVIGLVGENDGAGALLVDFGESFKRIAKTGKPGDRFGASLAPTV